MCYCLQIFIFKTCYVTLQNPASLTSQFNDYFEAKKGSTDTLFFPLCHISLIHGELDWKPIKIKSNTEGQMKIYPSPTQKPAIQTHSRKAKADKVKHLV